MSLLAQLTEEMKTAMKAGNKTRLSVLRMMVSAIRYVGIDAGEMTDEKVIAVLQKEAKKRRESIEAYTKAGRAEAAEQEKQELAIVEEYLPKMMGEEEIKAKVQEVLAGGSFPNFGVAMGACMAALKGQADGGTVSKMVKELYQ